MPIAFRPISPPPVPPARAVSVRSAPADAPKPATDSVAAVDVALGEILSPGDEPFDAQRVFAIRQALEAGAYPITPARIADALIASGLFLRSET